ncbi:MAG: putative glycoside hydrolase [Treponema sp.]|jgi:hypothetical protein|nr:putative glycoside hydrolase [Treponema sp.]
MGFRGFFKKIILCLIGCVFFPLPLYSWGKPEQGKKGAENKKQVVETVAQPVEQALSPVMLAGTGGGLYSIEPAGLGMLHPGEVRKILHVKPYEGNPDGYWAVLGSDGILVSVDLKRWEPRNQGLPVKTIKVFQDGNKTFLQMPQEIKDLEINPADPRIMVCATKDNVYISRDQGGSWRNLGAPPYRTNGIKAVASAYMPAANSPGGALTVFLSHSTYGVFYIQPDRQNARWNELNQGIEALETTGNTDEVSDIAVILPHEPDKEMPEIYISQTFRRRIYRLDWDKKKFNLVWSDKSFFGTVDSLFAADKGLYFLYEGTIASIDFPDYTFQKRDDILDAVRKIPAQNRINCAVIRNNSDLIMLSELWLLDESEPAVQNGRPPVSRIISHTPAAPPAALNKEGLYLPVNHAMDSRSLKPYLDVIEKGGLNMIVIDMKDDYGRLRFTPQNSAITAKGRVFRPLDVEAFIGDMKNRGIYSIARVVVFKDPEVAKKEDGKFAVWDSKNSKPWVGYRDERRKKSSISDADRRNDLMRFFPADNPEYEIVRTFYDERWVDPYSEEVWEYNAAVAAELHERGFDEIQFDYIRFPTDGVNIGDVRYRWKDQGMDMESAILSFLRHVRRRVKAPISIDIYGANGWYRTGARTGQEVELLAPWVDIISPMYYPSHFEQYFLAQEPPELRPWRIYYQGTLRTSRIGRGQIIVRPWVQAFSLNVSYDRRFYNANYVRYQREGVRAAGDGGLMYWNNSGRYEDIPARDSGDSRQN